jgi:L-alanine-DL-glutamate epimerase-like enolase superfamily enzyme
MQAGEAAVEQGRALGLPRLAAQFGPAQMDKAVADAVLRAAGVGWCDGVRRGLLGDPWSRHLPLPAVDSVALRHTVGLADRLRSDEPGPDPQDGLPATLQDAIAAYGLTHFKLKLCGVVERDIERLTAIAAVLSGHAPDWQVTLDGNESFADVDSLGRFWSTLRHTPALAALRARTLLLEQPLPRAITLSTSLADLGIEVPVIIDESDDHDEAFDEALALGYRGVSSKACKGLYRSLRNAAEVAAKPGAALLLSGEDLTCQAGLAVQQDTLLAASLGVAHIERNGHHYVDGFGSAPEAEAQAFLAAHPGLYHLQQGRVRLRVADGRLDLRSLHGSGFASGALPLWDRLQPIT